MSHINKYILSILLIAASQIGFGQAKREIIDCSDFGSKLNLLNEILKWNSSIFEECWQKSFPDIKSDKLIFRWNPNGMYRMFWMEGVTSRVFLTSAITTTHEFETKSLVPSILRMPCGMIWLIPLESKYVCKKNIDGSLDLNVLHKDGKIEKIGTIETLKAKSTWLLVRNSDKSFDSIIMLDACPKLEDHQILDDRYLDESLKSYGIRDALYEIGDQRDGLDSGYDFNELSRLVNSTVIKNTKYDF